MAAVKSKSDDILKAVEAVSGQVKAIDARMTANEKAVQEAVTEMKKNIIDMEAAFNDLEDKVNELYYNEFPSKKPVEGVTVHHGEPEPNKPEGG